jgi:hypothetical protein
MVGLIGQGIPLLLMNVLYVLSCPGMSRSFGCLFKMSILSNSLPWQYGQILKPVKLGQVSITRIALIFCPGGEHRQQSITYPHQPLLIIGSIIIGMNASFHQYGYQVKKH